ncbi:NADP-dependent oxidoreductase domain-containing protein [Lasiosphaeria miniovina]|uniref:NADP-dependent oxidoreductase domain-containing protein n=1 Tax=Lasiosphaeria miniovina TaxID=1954250 RepID=A0AA39ZU51_9PEZI|nr:NADP-dependent oxidoreductase domain-containing protein [Lasiosphaeria miniovina]KAK0703555.1 NADP-dependent oxidoreductase domain-containing protein [Lasiosphaeria miniovina]
MSIPAGIQESLKNTKRKYHQMGTNGLRVSVPIFGCGDLGDPRIISWAIQEDEELPLLKAAYDRGLNMWDTSNIYSHGASGTLIGKAIKNRAAIFNQASASLARLDTSYIDLLQIHRFDTTTLIEEKRGWPMSHVPLAWLNKRLTSPVVGFSSIARMDELLESGGKVLTDREENYLKELYLPKAIRGHV